MRFIIIIFILFCANIGFSQQALIPLHSFYKDQLLANKSGVPYNEGSFFPVNEKDYNLLEFINDSTKQYYKATHILFQTHLVDIKKDNFHLKISPIMNFAYGRDLGDTITRTLFQNTKGVHVECDILDNFSFSTSLYENQGRFTNYETQYYKSIGEQYPQADSTYNTQNAMIPGGARTKEFKGDGFDYAFASGYFVYQPFKWVSVTAGNNSLFIGDGHRSMLLSDNHSNSPYFKLDFKITKKWNFSYLRARHMNLLRKRASSSVEAFYDPKGFSVNYLTFKPTPKINISLFDGGVWNKLDSLETSKSAHPLFYNPIPLLSRFVLNEDQMASLSGVNVAAQIADKHRLYGQFGIYNLDFDKLALQVGYRGYDFFGLKDFMLQLEYNYASKTMYTNSNTRLNYSNYNLPLGPIKGNNFSELVLRTSYTINRVYAELGVNYYILDDYISTDLMAIEKVTPAVSGNVFYTNLELGYRFNRKMNLSVFMAWTYRAESTVDSLNANVLQFGVKTGFINHYKDF